MKVYLKKIFLLLVLSTIFVNGCGGNGSSNPSGPITPTEFVVLSGSLKAPNSIESSLIANTLQNTDSQVRDAFSSASIFVNGYSIKTFTLTALSSNPEWPLRLTNVPKSSNGNYRIEVLAGRLNLKAKLSEAEKDNFKIDLQSTAVSLLSDSTGIEAKNLLATYSSFVSGIEASLNAACQKSSTDLPGTIVQDASVTAILKENKSHLENLGGFEPTAKVAFLQKENDLDGDGVIDLKIEQNIDGDRIRFFTTLSSSTSLLADVQNMGSYSDERLLQDFQLNLTSKTRTFDALAKNFALGLYMKKSASADVYLKLYVRKIQLEDGSFKGVVAEYKFVKTETTALKSGTKTLVLYGNVGVDGIATATNFLTDGDSSPNMLTYISLADGIGCKTGDIRLVRAIDGQPELSALSYAERYLEGGGNYYLNTTAALKAIYKDRTIEAGDVFSAYFPKTKNYALFKIKWIGSDRIIIDYIVNAAQDEPRFN